MTPRRAAPPVDGWRRGRAASSVAGVGAAVAVLLLFFVVMIEFGAAGGAPSPIYILSNTKGVPS